jgi:hypothetical protein
VYGREDLRRLREMQAKPPEPEDQRLLLEQIPPDAPMDDATITVWNGERFVAYDAWRATAPIEREETPEQNQQRIPADATCVAGECGGTRIWLVKDGERWLMYVGSRKAGGRRRDFASPYLEHAIRTAEQWYGAAGGGWRAEKGSDGRARQAADLPPQDSTVEEGTGERGHDDLDLEGFEPGRG